MEQTVVAMAMADLCKLLRGKVAELPKEEQQDVASQGVKAAKVKAAELRNPQPSKRKPASHPRSGTKGKWP